MAFKSRNCDPGESQKSLWVAHVSADTELNAPMALQSQCCENYSKKISMPFTLTLLHLQPALPKTFWRSVRVKSFSSFKLTWSFINAAREKGTLSVSTCTYCLPWITFRRNTRLSTRRFKLHFASSDSKLVVASEPTLWTCLRPHWHSCAAHSASLRVKIPSYFAYNAPADSRT